MEKIISGETYRDQHFDREDLRAIDASECVFSHCTFVSANLTDAKCNGARFEDCTLQDAQVSGANFFDAQLIGCKLTGIDFSNKTKLLATQFKNCLFDFANFTTVDLSSIQFDRCSFIETNFSKSELKQAVYENCLIQDSLFMGAHFESTDFHTSKLSGMNIYADKVRGIILSPAQFLSMAGEIGISIVE